MNKVSAIILASGEGKRMGLGYNKQFIKLNNKPLIYYTIMAFERNDKVNEIIITSKESEISYVKEEIIKKYNIKKVKYVIAGGKQRQDSVYLGLKSIEECDIAIIHDGARPFVSNRIIDDGIAYADKYGASACGMMPKDTIKIKDKDNFSKETPDRNNLIAVQTPQCFKYELILKCHEKISKEGILVTDDTMVVEKFNHKVYLYDGDYTNIKVTTKEDIDLAEKISKYLS